MLSVNGLSATYGQAKVLFDMTFDLPNDSLTALLGRNGSGKTTTARALMGVMVRTDGELLLDGEAVQGLPTHMRARRGLQMVPEDRRVYTEFTVRENLELAHSAVVKGDPLPVDDILKLMPALQPLIGRMGNELSGGEQQMVAIARALVARPDILIMDEPSQGLAPVVLAHVRDAVKLLRQEFGTAVLLTEQNVPFAVGLADNVIVIDKGTIVFSGTRAEFEDREDIKSHYLSI